MFSRTERSRPGARRPALPVYPDRAAILNAGLVRRLAARRITPRLVLLYVAAVGLLVFATPWGPTFWLGAGIAALGGALRIWAFGHLRKNQALITSGPYAHVRNPAYLGSALVMTGLFLAAGSPTTITGIAIWAAGLVGWMLFLGRYLPRKYRNEYRLLERLFGDEARRYAHCVPNFVPRVTPWAGRDRQRFSWAVVAANHEWVWPLAVAAALGIIALG